MTIKEVEPTTFACLRIQSTVLPLYTEEMDNGEKLWCLEQRTPSKEHTMYHVPVSDRPSVVMIPAKATCPTSWTMEYYGYLMSAHSNHYRTMFECVDQDQESLYDSEGDSCSTMLRLTAAMVLCALNSQMLHNHEGS